jgi:quinoprotein glucose dehydrogenase
MAMLNSAGAFPRAAKRTLWLSIMLGAAPLAMAAAGDGNWTEYNGDKAGSRYLAGGKVTAQSVKSMKVAWRWAMPDN